MEILVGHLGMNQEDDADEEEKNDEGDRGIDEQVDDESNLTVLTLDCHAHCTIHGQLGRGIIISNTVNHHLHPHRTTLYD